MPSQRIGYKHQQQMQTTTACRTGFGFIRVWSQTSDTVVRKEELGFDKMRKDLNTLQKLSR